MNNNELTINDLIERIGKTVYIVNPNLSPYVKPKTIIEVFDTCLGMVVFSDGSGEPVSRFKYGHIKAYDNDPRVNNLTR